MSDPDRIGQEIVDLFDATPGEFRDMAIRQFHTDMEAHDPVLQERYAAEMASNFQAAISVVSDIHGPPVATVAFDDDTCDSWIEKLPISFNQLALWLRDDGHYFYVLNHHEDRELPLLIMAGVTD